MMVDSTPTVQAPPSSTAAIRPSRPPSGSSTSAARVGLMRPEALAEGIASGTPAACITARASGWAGTLSPTLSSPAVTREAIPASGRSATTSVSGPGQNAAASRAASPSMTQMPAAAAASGRCTISGLKAGRPLAS